MTPSELREILVDTIRTVILEGGGDPPGITGATCPLDLEGFDSLTAVDVELRLSELLEIELDGLPFDDNGVGKTVDQIVDWLSANLELDRVG